MCSKACLVILYELGHLKLFGLWVIFIISAWLQEGTNMKQYTNLYSNRQSAWSICLEWSGLKIRQLIQPKRP